MDIEWDSQTCLYLPGKIEGRSLQYLLDTGSSDNILSRTFFNDLPRRIQQTLQTSETTASMADGSGLHIYGTIELTCRIRTLRVTIRFRVANITNEAILGMRFLSGYKCTLQVDKGLLAIEDTFLSCTTRDGSLVTNKVQVVDTTPIPTGSEASIPSPLTTPPTHPIGKIESLDQQQNVCSAALLTRPSSQDKVLVGCTNTNTGPAHLNFRAETTVSQYTSIDKEQKVQDDQLPKWKPSPLSSASENSPTNTLHLDTLSDRKMYRQSSKRLGYGKDQEREVQVHDLEDKGMVSPVDSS